LFEVAIVPIAGEVAIADDGGAVLIDRLKVLADGVDWTQLMGLEGRIYPWGIGGSAPPPWRCYPGAIGCR